MSSAKIVLTMSEEDGEELTFSSSRCAFRDNTQAVIIDLHEFVMSHDWADAEFLADILGLSNLGWDEDCLPIQEVSQEHAADVCRAAISERRS